jgi:hypothetical protein
VVCDVSENCVSIVKGLDVRGYMNIETFFFQCHHMSLMDFAVSPPGCGRSVTDFLGWEAHDAQLRCRDEVDGDI